MSLALEETPNTGFLALRPIYCSAYGAHILNRIALRVAKNSMEFNLVTLCAVGSIYRRAILYKPSLPSVASLHRHSAQEVPLFYDIIMV